MLYNIVQCTWKTPHNVKTSYTVACIVYMSMLYCIHNNLQANKVLFYNTINTLFTVLCVAVVMAVLLYYLIYHPMVLYNGYQVDKINLHI